MSSYIIRRISADQIKTLLPPRTFLEVGSKAFSGSWSLLADQKQRDFFTKNVKNGIIRDDIFWQNGANSIGPMVALALYQELQDPVLKKYGFEAEEFLDGVGPALERYHDVEKSIDNRLFELLNKDNAEQREENGKCNAEENNELENRVANETEAPSAALSAEDRLMMTELAERETSILGVLSNQKEEEIKLTNEKFPKILNWDWKDELVEVLRPMVSDSYFRALQLDKLLSCILLKQKGLTLTYQSGTSSVENVALLSARVKLMNENETNIDRIEHEELEMKEPNESNMPVAVQIEVLYDIEHNVSTVAEAPKTENTETKSGEFTERLVFVGVLEGFLKGGSDGVLQWKLSNIREPWEIPPVETSFSFRPDEK